MQKLITFILPTIGRLSIINTIQSLKRLKTDLWECIILFDGIKNTILPILKQDRRFRIFEIEKLGGTPNHAGLIRNYGFSFVSTPWIGFIDDDDTLSPYYIDHLLEEIKIQNDQLDSVIFRMIYRNKMILPNKDDIDIKEGHVGISFCFKRTLLHEYPELQFENNSIEDFLFLQKMKNLNLKIVLSPYIEYYVKSNYFPLPDMYKDLPRYIIVSKDKMKEKLKELKILNSQHQISTQKQYPPSQEVNIFQKSVYEKLLKPSRDLMNEENNEKEEYQFEDEFSKTPILYTSYLNYHNDEDNESFLEDTKKEEFINKPLEEPIFHNEKKIENYEKEIEELLQNQFKNNHYPLSSKSKKRIYLESQGGFGNLLFQVFTALSLCIQYNRELYILHNENSTLQRPDIDKYSIFQFLNIIHKHEIPGYYVTFKEPNLIDYQSIHSFMKSNIQDDIYIKGYFQCVYYFQDIVPKIEPYLNFTNYHISQKILKIWKETENIQHKKCIGVHIRGMDYKSLKHIYHSLSDEYYQRMLNTIHRDEYHLILFTDDIPYVKENFSFYKKYDYHFARSILKKCNEYRIKNLDEIELYIFSQMDILLCANSTFSLWSTYFSKKDSILYIPSLWYHKDGPSIPYSHFLLKGKNYRHIMI